MSARPSAAAAATRFILYARKSNDREDRQMRSLGDQEKIAHAEAKQFGLHVVYEILESKSAKRPGKRDGFQEMIRLIEEGKADGILCWHPDRLARNAVDGGWILDLLDRGLLKDLRFLSTYSFENTPEGKLMLGMIFSQAKYQIDKLGSEVSRGMREMREEGGFPHYVPEGYRNVCLEDGRKAVATDPERFPLLRRAVELILSEVYTPAEARRLLNSWGYETRTTTKRPGGPLRESAFYRILHNPFYAGRCRDGEGWYEGKHEQLMSIKEFEMLQKIVGRKDVPVLRRHAFPYAGGLLTCGVCGCQIVATFSKGRHGRGAWVYYHCTNRRGVCNRRGTREEVLEGSVQDLLRQLTIPEELEDVLYEMTVNALDQRQRMQGETEEGVARRLNDAKAERERLLPLLLKGVLTGEDYQNGKQALDQEIAALMERLAQGSTRTERERQSARNAVAFAAHALNAFETSGTAPQVKRRVVQMLATKRVLTPNEPLLEPHTYLHGFLEEAPKLTGFKPRNLRSCITKQNLSEEKSCFGRPNVSRIQTCCEEAADVDKACRRIAGKLAESIAEHGEEFPELPSEGLTSSASDGPESTPRRQAAGTVRSRASGARGLHPRQGSRRASSRTSLGTQRSGSCSAQGPEVGGRACQCDYG